MLMNALMIDKSINEVTIIFKYMKSLFKCGAHVSNMQLRQLIAYTMWWMFGAIEFRFGSLTSILKSQYSVRALT